MDGLDWLSRNLAFSFFIGMFLGVFMIDGAHSSQLVARLKRFAEENTIILKYEGIRDHIRNVQEKASWKYHFITPFRSEYPLSEHLKEIAKILDDQRKKHQ